MFEIVNIWFFLFKKESKKYFVNSIIRILHYKEIISTEKRGGKKRTEIQFACINFSEICRKKLSKEWTCRIFWKVWLLNNLISNFVLHSSYAVMIIISLNNVIILGIIHKLRSDMQFSYKFRYNLNFNANKSLVIIWYYITEKIVWTFLKSKQIAGKIQPSKDFSFTTKFYANTKPTPITVPNRKFYKTFKVHRSHQH